MKSSCSIHLSSVAVLVGLAMTLAVTPVVARDCKFLLDNCSNAPEVPQGPKPTPQPQRPAATASVVMTKISNHWVKGEGYRAVANGMSYADCEQMCLADTRCRMVEFYFGKAGARKCSFFDHQTAASTPATDAHIALKSKR